MLLLFLFNKKEFLLIPVCQCANVVNSWGDKALENRRVFGCGQECLSSVLISFFFVSKAACSSAILLVSLCCSPFILSALNHKLLASHLLCNISVHFRYPRSCFRSNSLLGETYFVSSRGQTHVFGHRKHLRSRSWPTH